MIKIKICGITEIEHALAASQAGADFIGLVFAPSRRQISTEKARQITEAIHSLKSKPEIVGVFANTDVDELNRLTDYLCLDRVQLSGGETLDYCRFVNRPIIKTIHVASDDTAAKIINVIKQGYELLTFEKIIYHLDTKAKGMYGGSGKNFDWTLAREISKQFPIIIAGGLTPENVAYAISEIRPFGVDVSSGVETEGKKDVAKIIQFIRTAREAELHTHSSSTS